MKTGHKIPLALGWMALLLLEGCMIAIPAMHYLCLRNGLHTGYIAGIIYAFGIGGFAVLAASLVARRKKIRISKYEILFGLLLIFAGISAICSGNPGLSLWGSPARCEGLYMLHCYYLFFYLARTVNNPKMRKSLILGFLVVQLFHCVYGLNQQYHFMKGGFDYYFYAISGLAGNPNFMGTLTVMASSITLGLVLFSQRWNQRVGYGVLLLLLFSTLLLTKTLSAIVGMTAVFLCLLGYLSIKNRRLFAGTLLGGAIVFVGLLWLTNGGGNTFLSTDLEQLVGQMPTLFTQGIQDPTVASGRPYLWYRCLQLVSQHPITGVGIDNLQQPYYEQFGLLLGQYADKSHNELFQVMVTMGIPAFLCYLSLYGFLIGDQVRRVKGSSPAHQKWEMGLLLCLIGYLVQGCFNVSVIDVAPYFWILCGLMAPPLFSQKENKETGEQPLEAYV